MSERKVINKYYPPDFDPLKVQAVRKKKNNKSKDVLQTVRLMTPFSMRCLSCNEYIAKSKKFNARKQDTNERYLQQKIYRFHIRCPSCNGEIIFRTDPKTSDFVMELGGERNYNPVANKQQETKLETYDEVLERLEKEEQLEKEELMNKDKLNKMTKVQALEEKLLEQEEEDRMNEELSKMTAKMKRQDGIVINLQNTDAEQDYDDDLDKLAAQEFSKFKQAQQEARKVSKTFDVNIADPLVKADTTMSNDKIDKNIRLKAGEGGLVLGYDSSSEEEEEEQVIKKVVVGKKRALNAVNSNLTGSIKRVRNDS